MSRSDLFLLSHSVFSCTFVRLEVIGLLLIHVQSSHWHVFCVWTQLEQSVQCFDISPDILMVQTSGYHQLRDDSIQQNFAFRCLSSHENFSVSHLTPMPGLRLGLLSFIPIASFEASGSLVLLEFCCGFISTLSVPTSLFDTWRNGPSCTETVCANTHGFRPSVYSW